MKVKNLSNSPILPVMLTGLAVLFFWLIYPVFPNSSTSKDRVILWMADAWRGDFIHGWAVPVLFVVFISMAWKTMKAERIKSSSLGMVSVVFGILLFLASVRTLQPRIALFGLPFLIFGGVYFVYGWRVARHVLFPAFFWYFAITLPGLQQATNGLQVMVTKSCYQVGTFFGMDLIIAGNNIYSADGSWNELKIAEGCSGIRSVMALVMISAIYAYYTQKSIWKKAFLFACSLPLSMGANFLRIFTILVLSEMGYSEFGSGIYHDWAGLLFFFPVALTGLFLIDKLLNWKENRKVVRVRTQE